MSAPPASDFSQIISSLCAVNVSTFVLNTFKWAYSLCYSPVSYSHFSDICTSVFFLFFQVAYKTRPPIPELIHPEYFLRWNCQKPNLQTHYPVDQWGNHPPTPGIESCSMSFKPHDQDDNPIYRINFLSTRNQIQTIRLAQIY